MHAEPETKAIYPDGIEAAPGIHLQLTGGPAPFDLRIIDKKTGETVRGIVKIEMLPITVETGFLQAILHVELWGGLDVEALASDLRLKDMQKEIDEHRAEMAAKKAARETDDKTAETCRAKFDTEAQFPREPAISAEDC